MTVFSVTVQTTDGLPLSGAAVKLLAPDGTDLTASRFGASPVYTDATGKFTKTYSGTDAQLATGGLPQGNYQIVASLTGYQTASINTGGLFQGYGNFEASLNVIVSGGNGTGASGGPATATSIIEGLDLPYVSPMAPAEFLVDGVSSSAPWELIEATVTDAAGNVVSSIEVPVVGGKARVNLQARLELEPLPHLVSDGELVAVDSDFSKTFVITLASLTPAGRLPLTNTLTVHSGNAFPTLEENNLVNFTNFGDLLADWLTPWADTELPKFLGHYADAGMWLPYPGTTYTLHVSYQTINRVELSTQVLPLPAAIVNTGQALRIRIPEPITGASYAVLTVFLGAEVQSHPLTVRYING